MAELKIGRETALYLIALVFLIIGGIGLLIGVDVMTGLGALAAIVSAFLARSPLKSGKGPKVPPAAALALALGATIALGACASSVAPGTLAARGAEFGIAMMVPACEEAHAACVQAAPGVADDEMLRELWRVGCDAAEDACVIGRDAARRALDEAYERGPVSP